MQGPFSARLIDGCRVHLRVLATSDLHMHLLPFDYGRNRRSVNVGLARTAGLIAAGRAGARNTLLVDNGDFLQGTPMADLAAADLADDLADDPTAGEPAANPGRAHPAIAAMNSLRYDAAALGNHEFNYGLGVLRRAVAGATFPMLAANAATRLGDTPCADRTLVAPFTILTRRVTDLAGRAATLKVGLIGLVPPQVAVWDRDNVAGRVWFRDMLETAAARVPELRAAGADIVLALAHTGIGSDGAATGMENAAIPLARVPGIDALVLGHAHQVFPSPLFTGRAGVDAANGLIEGRPAVMPGAYGSHLGVMDLLLEPGANGWQVAASAVAAHPIARVRRSGRLVPRGPVVPEVAQTAAAAHARTRAWVARPVGISPHRLCTHFALVADTPAFRLVAEAKAAHVRACLAETEWAGLPVLGSGAPFRTGGLGAARAFTDIPPGRLTARHIAELYPFPNRLRAVVVGGAELRCWLERSVGLYRTIAPGEDGAPLLQPGVPGYTFSLLAGLSFDICPEQAPGQRIRGLSHAGRPVAADDRFVIATSTYRAAISAPAAPVILAQDVKVAHLIERFVASGSLRSRNAAEGWRLRLPPGARVTYDSAPGARAEALGGLAVHDLGLTEGGFRRFALHDAGSAG